MKTMKFAITREQLLKGLQFVAGVIERRQSLPILANVLLRLKGQELAIIGTDLEVELTTRVSVAATESDGEITVSGRKLLDICKSLTDDAVLECTLDKDRLLIRSGQSRFTLATLPAKEFPLTSANYGKNSFSVSQNELFQLFDSTHFAMAQQDVRYYLNGLFFELNQSHIRTVATDGHRLALHTQPFSHRDSTPTQFILPRKGVIELMRLLRQDTSDAVDISFGNNALKITAKDFTFVSRLIDGTFPDYNRVLPKGGDKVLLIERETLRQSLSRVAVLSNEKYRAVSLRLKPNLLSIVTHNVENEEAHDEISINYQQDPLEIAFNVNYLIDAISALPNGVVKITLSNADGSALIESNEQPNSLFVVMPMCL